MEQTAPHRILIVDDELKVCKSIGMLLDMAGIGYTCADNGMSALEKIREADRPFSLIISDQRMPGMEGTDFLELVKDTHPETTRFLMTGYSDIDIIIKAVNRGSVHKYITKPWSNDEFMEFINEGLTQYEMNVESRRLLNTAKQQNKRLYSLDQELMELTAAHEKEIQLLDREIREIESQINATPSPIEILPEPMLDRVTSHLTSHGAVDLQKITELYLACARLIHDEFRDLAKQRGIDMPRSNPGGHHE